MMYLRADCSKKSRIFECMEFELWSTFSFVENENSSLRLTRVTKSYALKFHVKTNSPREKYSTVHEHDVLDDVARQINEEQLIFPFFFFFSIVDQIGFEDNHWFHRGIRRVSRGNSFAARQIDANRLIISR